MNEVTAMLRHSMSPNTRDRNQGRGTGSIAVVVCAGALGALLMGGCGSSMRDEHARVRSAVIEAKPGDGRLVASAIWTGESFAFETPQVRVAAATGDTSEATE